MTLDVKHLKTSALPDGVDTDKVQPSDWNDSHQLTGFGGAAELNVGTVAGTVAAGDHVHSADQITVVPSGSLISTDVQAALEELNSDLDAAVMTTSIGKHTIWVPALAMTARTTNGAASGSTEIGTNKIMTNTLDFDPDAIEYAQFTVRMPKSWDGDTLSASFTWSHLNVVDPTGIVWGIQALAVTDNGALDASFGTAVTVNDSNENDGTNRIYFTDVTTNIVPEAIAENPIQPLIIFQIFRNATDATNDTMNDDGRLHGVTIYYTTSASTDD